MKNKYLLNLALAGFILFLAIEIYCRLQGANAYALLFPRFLEIHHRYDSHLGWVGTPGATVNPGVYGILETDDRGFVKLPNIQNDTNRNQQTIAFIGRCCSYVGGDSGPDKNFMNLLAGELGGQFDFDAMGHGGYTLYQDYLLARKFNHGQYDIVMVPVYPEVDFYMNTPYVKSGYTPLVGFNNRQAPQPRSTPQGIRHKPVPCIKSFWNEPPDPSPQWTPNSHSRKNLSPKERLFISCYSLAMLLQKIDTWRSYDPTLTREIMLELARHTQSHNGTLLVLINNVDIDQPSERIMREGDAFIRWLDENNIAFIDLRHKLKGHSMALTGDPYHTSAEGEVIKKNEVAGYLRHNVHRH